MKKLFLFFVMAMPVLFSACDSDDDIEVDDIIGTWTLSDIDVGVSVLGYETNSFGNIGSYIDLSTGSSITFYESGSFSGSMLSSYLGTSSGTYSISGSTLTLTDSSSSTSTSLTIKNITEDNLELKMDITNLDGILDILGSLGGTLSSLINTEVYAVLTCTK